jgi:MFS family permease
LSLARRNYGLLLAFDAAIYTPLYWPYMFHLVCELRGLSALQFGTLKAIYYASVIALELPGGVIADRFGRRGALIACAALNAAGCFMYGFAGDFWAFAAAELVIALSTALLSGADSALLYDPLLAAQGFPVDRYGAVSVGISLAAAFAAYRSAHWLARGERTLTLAMPLLALVMYVGLALISGPWIAAALCLQGPLVSC